jgi:hypothetical protein
MNLMLAGGLGVYLGSVLSPRVDVILFRRLIILLLILGANVMLFAGAPGMSAAVGVSAIVAGLLMYTSALWHGDGKSSYIPVASEEGSVTKGAVVPSAVEIEDDEETPSKADAVLT